MRVAGRLWKALVLLACAVSPWLLYLAVSGGVAGPLGPILVAANGLLHAAVYFFLLWFFGRTLLQGREALITVVARRVHGTLLPEIEAYTRRITLAWCFFFSAQLVVSGLLFAFASLDTWSLFVGALNIPLLALMFIGEYFYRIVRYPNHPRVSIAKALRAFAQDASVSTGAKAR